MKRLGVIYACLLPLLTLSAAEDAYHQALRQQLEMQYGITGGTWVLPETEKQVNSSAKLTNVTAKKIAYSGAEPFTEILELKTTAKRANSWDNAVRFPTSQAVKKGDVLLLVFWMNSIESDNEDKTNLVYHKFELAYSPYTQSINQGATIKPGWRQWLLPFEAVTDYPAGASGSRYQIDMGFMKGTIQIAGVAVINYGRKYRKDQLPYTTHHMEYAGREPDAPWRAEALARIEQIRKGDLKIKVINRNGQPVRNAHVKADMLRHEFGFGTAIAVNWFLTSTRDAQTYRQKLLDLTGDGRSFNMVVFENALKWDAWEGDGEGTKQQVVDIISWLRNNEIRIRGHCLVWPGQDWLPARIVNNLNNLDYVRNEIRDHIYELAGYPGVQGNIEEWDVINEMVHNKLLENAFGTQDIYKEWLEWAHDADPDALLYLNEYSILSSEGLDTASQQAYKALLKKLIDAGAPIGGLGIQTHVGSNLTPPTRVLQILDYFADLGLHISITEYDAAGAHPEIAGDYMRDILICAFSHPAMKNFLMWGFWDGSHWLNDAPIFYRDWSLKPSGRSFIDWVFYRWWTNAEGTTDEEGNFITRAFYGDYEIQVEAAGVKAYRADQFSRTSGEFVLQLNTDATEVLAAKQPELFQVVPPYPNPFNSETVIGCILPSGGRVFLQLFDLSGRHVRTIINEYKSAGEYTFRFSADTLPSGVYLYMLSFEQEKQLGKLTLIR